MDRQEPPFEVKVDVVSIDERMYVAGPDPVVISAIVHHAVEDGLVSAHDVAEVLNQSWQAGREGNGEIGEGSTSNVIAPDMTWIVAPFELPEDIKNLADRDPDFMRDMAYAMKTASEVGAGLAVDRPRGLLEQAASAEPSRSVTAIGPVVHDPDVLQAARSVEVGR